MRFPFISLRQHNTEIDSLRKRVLDTEARHDAAEEERRRLASQYTALEERYTDTAIVNECLTHDLANARAQLAAQDTDDWLARYEAEKKRADHLQSRLDDAVGLKPTGIQDSSRWQPGYKAPKEDTA